MSQIKYTDKGKKVVIVGKLNNTETIVQEIYVSQDGSEIPSGENFVVKSLHDEPLKSWYETNLEKVKSNYESKKLTYEQELQRLKSYYDKQSKLLRETARQVRLMVDEICHESFDTLIDFLTGEIKYVVTLGYDPKILKFDESIYKRDFGGSIKLLSFYGKSDGKLDYRLNEYSDGSGSETSIIPVKTFDQAKMMLTNYLVEKKRVLNEYEMIAVKYYDLQLPVSVIERYKNDQIKSKNERIQSLKKEIESLNQGIQQIIESSNE